jgi:hypothetical protein
MTDDQKDAARLLCESGWNLRRVSRTLGVPLRIVALCWIEERCRR